jgi:hypothetical protein
MIAVGPPPNNDTVSHGERIPSIPPLKLLAIGDAELEDGLAYHFRTTYDKVVLLSEEELSMAKELQVHPSTLDISFKPGDTLWQCTFNDSKIEGYIYPTRARTSSTTNTASGTVNTENSTKLPDFPYAVKLVEEWKPNGKVPCCTKMTMEQDGTLTPLSEEVMLSLDNSMDEAAFSTLQHLGRIRHRKPRQEAQSNECQCQWVID